MGSGRRRVGDWREMVYSVVRESYPDSSHSARVSLPVSPGLLCQVSTSD